jgi:hypothetical protein
MATDKSLDDSYTIIAALLRNVSNRHAGVFNTSSLRKTLNKVLNRFAAEGMGFLSKTLPRLGKAFDKAISGTVPMDATSLGFEALPNSKLPKLLGEFFQRVLSPDGVLLEHPCVISVAVIRQVLMLFYKYELPYTDEQEQQVVARFEKTEDDLTTIQVRLQEIAASPEIRNHHWPKRPIEGDSPVAIAREARSLLERLFCSFDPKNIYPRHGPGAVATKQQLWEKFLWTNVSAKITDVYPFDAYFCASAGHVCDTYDSFAGITDRTLPARVLLVPKDSRGPRLISCEPVDFQWIQQGLGTAIVDLVEHHPLTRDNVRFTDQSPNRFGALEGSRTGRYATLDLNEASDRVSTELVRLLFPDHVLTYLIACRTSSTVLPDGRELELKKFAPMGSSLCFPILALTVWAILTAGIADTDTKDSIYVYGDDVIVPTHYARNAIERLEAFGLKVNQDKSCTAGLFRESCGMDAFQGVNVTPVRLRTVWSSSPGPDVYSSWIAYANSFYDRQYFGVYDSIVERLVTVYGAIPDRSMNLSCPCLAETPEQWKPKRRRVNKSLQKLEYYVRDVRSPVLNRTIDGWSMLLRYLSECANSRNLRLTEKHGQGDSRAIGSDISPFSVRQYTRRKNSTLFRRWL